MLGCGLPGGEQGYNMGRIVSILAGLHDVPGTTVTRYCSSSLQTIRMAAHAIRAGEGDVFVAAGVECVSRFAFGSSDGLPGTQNPQFGTASARTGSLAAEGGPRWAPAEGLPDVYIAMGQTAENVAQLENVGRAEMDEFAARSQNLAVESIKNGFFEREITPVTLPDGGSSRPTTARGRIPRSRDWPSSSPPSNPTVSSPPATPARSTMAPRRWWS